MQPRRTGRKALPLGDDGREVSLLGATIRAWREHRQLSTTELAVRAGFGGSGRAYISKVEHGRLTPGDAKLDGIAAALGVTGADLLAHRFPPATPTPPPPAPPDPAARRRRMLRLGSGYPIRAQSRSDVLRTILRRAGEIEQLAAELLREEEKGENP